MSDRAESFMELCELHRKVHIAIIIRGCELLKFVIPINMVKKHVICSDNDRFLIGLNGEVYEN